MRQAVRSLVAPGALALVSGTTACNADFSGFNDLLNAAPTFVSFPGKRLAPGKLEKPSVERTAVTEPHVIAFDTTDATRILIAPFDRGGICRTGRANTYQRFQFPSSAELELIVPYVKQSGEERELHFVDASCSERVAPIAGASLPLSPHRYFDDPPRYLVRSGDRLLFVDPWKGRTTTLAEGVDRYAVTDDHIWTLEAGQVVQRKRDGAVVRRLGADVTELDASVFRDRAAYVDGGELYWVDPAEDDEPVLVDEDVCRIGFPTGWGARGLYYFSPCADRRLVVFEIDRPARSGFERVDERYELGDSVVSGPVIQDLSDPFVFYWTSSDPKAKLATLWGGKLGDPPERIADSVRTDAVSATVRGKWPFIVDEDPATGAGRLVFWEPAEPLKTALEGVVRYDDPFAVANYDGTVGDAVWLGKNGSRKIASGVPQNGIRATPVGTSVIRDFDGSSGTLLVSTKDDELSFERVASKVQPASVAFIGGIEAVGYLRQYDPEKKAGLLGVRVLATADTFDVDLVADDWTVTEVPEPGVLYTVPSGSTRGLWYARLK